MSSDTEKMGKTEKRFGMRIALPVAIACGVAFLASLAFQMARDDESDGVDNQTVEGEIAAPSSDVSREDGIAIIQQATQSLHTAYQQKADSGSASAEEIRQMEAKRSEVQQTIKRLETAGEDEWRPILAQAYAQVNAYARAVGVDPPPGIETE